ncbi:unnamed protein product [Absidia cylindrospora]
MALAVAIRSRFITAIPPLDSNTPCTKITSTPLVSITRKPFSPESPCRPSCNAMYSVLSCVAVVRHLILLSPSSDNTDRMPAFLNTNSIFRRFIQFLSPYCIKLLPFGTLACYHCP